jgi:hypothetical protein
MPPAHELQRKDVATVAATAALALLLSASAAAEPASGVEPPLDLRYRHRTMAGATLAPTDRGTGLARSIDAASKPSLWDLGMAASRQALRDCQAGQYPGANLGAISSAQLRPNAQADHCHRF